ncbi:MAG: riboflavin biosynthesis protein RibF [Clostridiales bacterium]|nr:riboflavin biosynthesis protein RibF [Clostridiales bacterium]MCD7826998.1 riboflavin biosynthesis protein RibF [Clostridiales bacterium]
MAEITDKKTAVALGAFDGLHIGHMSVINRAVVQRNSGLLPVILLFSEHPLSVLSGKAPPALFEGGIKKREIEKTGCVPYEVSFKEIRNMTPEEFISEILVKKLNAGFVSCGFNFRFGKKCVGDSDILKSVCEKYSIKTEIAKEVDYNGEPVSSSRIRTALFQGDIRTANAMLGRHFGYDFTVEHGDERGHTLGFPTINQFFSEGFAVPKYGVYASAAEVDGVLYPSMTNIGVRPTVGSEKAGSETCILGYSGMLYGRNIPVFLIEYLRPEIKFGSLRELSEQMSKDSKKSAEIFKAENMRW